MIEEHLALPFQTTVLGTHVIVEQIDITDRHEIVGVCAHGEARQ